MTQEIALFWLVLAAFLFADNLVLIPKQGDFLKFGLRGRLSYRPGVRLQARGRDLLLLNPLNPFDRVAVTTQAAGALRPGPWRVARQRLRKTLKPINQLSWLGCAYLVLLVLLLGSSFHLHFGAVLALLAAAHVSVWLVATCMLVAGRRLLQLTRYQVFTLATEALFVPAYTLNLGKRVWYRHVLDVPAMAVGLWHLKRMPDGPPRDVYAFKLAGRLDDWALDVDIGAGTAGISTWLKEARLCLKASAPAAGS